MGLATQAFHYCEVIAKNILAQPAAHSLVLISQLVQVGSPDAFPASAVLTVKQVEGIRIAGLGMGWCAMGLIAGAATYFWEELRYLNTLGWVWVLQC
jgi:hypothetical protein